MNGGSGPAATGCRGCGGVFFPSALLHLPNMPKGAQKLPRVADLASERGEDLDLWQCADCGLLQLAVPPVSYYREVIRASGFSEEMKAFRRDQFTRFIARHGLAGRRVIEYGCGNGEYLALLAEQPVVAAGLEASPEAVARCRQAGLDVRQGFAGDVPPPDPGGPFDAFLLLSHLEHLPDPGQALRTMARHLVEGGLGLVEVPNLDMILEQELFSEFIPDHLFYFTRETLGQLLSRNGFEVVDCAEVWHRYILSATVRKRSPLDLAPLRRRQSELERQLRAFAGQAGPRGLAVWGAGHQALAVLSLARLEGQVRYVVDSAPFKQGCFTPATHLPIRPPQSLRTDPVSAVLVMAASYSDEVASLLLRDYPEDFALAVLRPDGLEILRAAGPAS